MWRKLERLENSFLWHCHSECQFYQTDFSGRETLECFWEWLRDYGELTAQEAVWLYSSLEEDGYFDEGVEQPDED